MHNGLQTALDKQNIMYVDIPYRAKSKKSFLKKWEMKKYSDIFDMTDVAGIRVITLVESDLDEVEETIRKLFKVHEADSGDKADKLGHDKFGYRSRHFVCDIGKKRETLLELEHFKDKCFEIQIRTALAHAWAEIEHDRGYKLEGGLPSNLKRRLNIVAALLESADNEFNRLTKDIEEYKNNIDQEIKNNNLNMPLDAINISALLKEKYHKYFKESKIASIDSDRFNNLKEEIEYMGINNIQELDIIIGKTLKFLIDLSNFQSTINSTDVGFIRLILMSMDVDKYFSQELAWNHITKGSYDILCELFGAEKIKNFNLKCLGDGFTLSKP